MKKKKRDTKRHNIPAAVLHWMLFTRYYLLQFPLLSAFFGFLLLLFASFAFLSPLPPIINHHNHSLQLKNGAKAEESTLSKETSSFRVPRSGWRLGRHLWSSRSSKFYYGCSNASESFETADRRKNSDRYLLIATSGGLNQQRTGITDGVVAAYILNATLVVPKLDQKSFWNDSSDFAQIFDVDWFISFLSKDVTIIKQLHGKGGKALNPYRMRVPRKCTPTCYLTKVLPVLNKKHAVQLGKFDYRLSNRLDPDLQKLRCRVNYHALKFTDSILEMGKKLVQRMRMKSEHFIALHLRFEPDMLAFSGCYFGGGEKERMELGKIRRRWKSLHTSNPDKERRQGRCPLTPEEVGLMLRALGFGSDVHLYVASGEVYGGEETLAPLKALFPNFHSKETLASMRELAPFSSFSSRMAALDFIVCDESDVFSTNNNGNMAKILAGRRRYFGHKPTIRPNAKKLYKLFMSRHNKTWEEFASRVRTHQIGFMGEPNEVKPGRGEFHENPSSCICEDSAAKARAGLTLTPQNLLDESHKNGKENINKNETSDVTDEHSIEDDQDLTDMDYLDRETAIKGKGLPGEMLLEEFFSD
ncbi:protein ROOT HAIR SPECIFIC [Salix suchowensis]|nr:protein ROOT HAIR SPECIFIC [Salix suchowensis]